MMSQTSANVDANVNPGYVEIHIEKCKDDDVGLLDGWEHWSLEDIIRTIESMKKAKAERGKYGGYGEVSLYLGEITLNKLLKAANDPNVSFDLIEKTVNLVLYTNLTVADGNIIEFVGFLGGWELICNFLKVFVKHGESDARYYNLIYMILTHQSRKNDSFPIGHAVRTCEGFEDAVLAKLPLEMRKQLEGESFYAEDGDVSYSLLTDAAVNM